MILETLIIISLIIMLICNCIKERRIKRFLDGLRQQQKNDGYYYNLWACIIEVITIAAVIILLILDQAINRNFKEIMNLNGYYIFIFVILLLDGFMSARQAWILMSDPVEENEKEKISEDT